MNITDERSGDILILRLSGRLDSNSSPQFEKHLLERIGAGERRLVLDFAGLDFVSSAGLRILLMGAKHIRQGGAGKMVLCGLKAPIHEVLKVSGFLALLNVCEGCGEALALAGG